MKKSGIIMYKSEQGNIKIKVNLEDKTIWLTQKQIAELFNAKEKEINVHIKKIYEEQELNEHLTTKEVKEEGDTEVLNEVKYYNLDLVLAVSYRVKTQSGIEFRRWITKTLKEYFVKGFIMDDEFLINNGGGEYFRELLIRLKEIRSTKKLVYRQAADLYTAAIDYDNRPSEISKFFRIVQNKLNYAVSKRTVSEILYSRADHKKPFVGMCSFRGNEITREDIYTARNYLNKAELRDLNSLVGPFFDLIEIKTMKHLPTSKEDLLKELDDFTKKYGKGALLDSGMIENEESIYKADKEYERYLERMKKL